MLSAIQARLANEASDPLSELRPEEDRRGVNTTSRTLLDRLAVGMDAILLDEAQRLDDPGLTLKALHDLHPHLIIIATGSSSFDLRNRVTDALTGRYLDFLMLPFSLAEALAVTGALADPALRQPTADALLPDALLYGLYPEVYLEGSPKTRQLLRQSWSRAICSATSWLSPHPLFAGDRGPCACAGLSDRQRGQRERAGDAAEGGSQDRRELPGHPGEIVRHHPPAPYSTTRGVEIGKLAKIYFLDLGIRNGLINDFNDLALRPDRGRLWENFLVIERLKHYASRGDTPRSHFGASTAAQKWITWRSPVAARCMPTSSSTAAARAGRRGRLRARLWRGRAGGQPGQLPGVRVGGGVSEGVRGLSREYLEHKPRK